MYIVHLNYTSTLSSNQLALPPTSLNLLVTCPFAKDFAPTMYHFFGAVTITP